METSSRMLKAEGFATIIKNHSSHLRQEYHWCTHQHALSANNSVGCWLNQYTTASCHLTWCKWTFFSLLYLMWATNQQVTQPFNCAVLHKCLPVYLQMRRCTSALQQQCCGWDSVVFALFANLTCIQLQSTCLIPLSAKGNGKGSPYNRPRRPKGWVEV